MSCIVYCIINEYSEHLNRLIVYSFKSISMQFYKRLAIKAVFLDSVINLDI